MELHTPIIAQRFRIGRKIGEGSFGEVYTGIDTKSGSKVAIKLSKIGKENNLAKEANFYRMLDNATSRPLKEYGIPNLRWAGKAHGYYFVILDRLGPSFSDLLEESSGGLPIDKVVHLAVEGLTILEKIHNLGILHRDIKPNNFLTGLNPHHGRDKVYIIDFGLAKRYLDEDQKHHSLTYDHKLVGTARYTSCNTHLGLQQGRRDDLESFGYMLVYLATGTLPWTGFKDSDKGRRYEKIGEMKRSLPVSKICAGLPSSFGYYLEYCRQLDFAEKPDYEHLRNIFLGNKAH